MQVSRSDPRHESPAAAAHRFHFALARVAAFVLLLWVVLAVDRLLGLDLHRWGLRPWRVEGLLGLLTMPLLHGGVMHLIHNTLPTLTLGTGLLYFYPRSRWRVIPWFWIAPGLFVWLVGAAGSTHFGASGLNFALLAYLALGGLLRREVGTLALSLAVMFYYGGMFSGVLPLEPGVSWEGHLGGLLTGIALAIAYRRWDIPPRKHYDWEDEDDEEDETDDEPPVPTVH